MDSLLHSFHPSHPKSYKRYGPSPNTNPTGYPIARPRPLLDRIDLSGLKFGSFGQSKGPESLDKFDLIDNSGLLEWATRRRKAYEHTLDEPHPSSHDVYIVSRVHGDPILARHWSVCTQGHFYHLSVDKSASHSGIGRPLISETAYLKDEDHSHVVGYDVTPRFPLPPLFVAYHIGQTDYTSFELHDLARQIINDIGSYNIFFRNCQHFVTTFIMNILMRERNNNIFIGTQYQIASWDLQGKYTGVHSNTVERGFLVLAPKRTLLESYISVDANM